MEFVDPHYIFPRSDVENSLSVVVIVLPNTSFLRERTPSGMSLSGRVCVALVAYV